MAPAQRAPDFYCATSDARHRSLRSGRIRLLTDILSSSPKDVILAPTDFRRGILLCPEIVLSGRRYAALVGLGRPSACGMDGGDEGEDGAHSSLSGFNTRTMPRTRHGWGTRQSRWLRTADGFAVSGQVAQYKISQR